MISNTPSAVISICLFLKEQEKEALNQKQHKYYERVNKLIDYANENKKLICAICAAPSILGHKGLLKGKEATCYPGFEDSFNGGIYVKKSVVKSDNFITSNGMGSAYKFGFEITAALTSWEVADKIKTQIQE